MRILGYALITAGFLAGAYQTVREVEDVALAPYLLAVGLGVAGVIMVRIALHRSATHEDRLTANLGELEASLGRLVDNAARLEAEKQSIDVYELRHRIDEIFLPDLDLFASARESIAHSYGLQAYADVMNRFAAAERYLRRVWSASTDGYIDEAHTYIAKADHQLRDALDTFRALARA